MPVTFTPPKPRLSLIGRNLHKPLPWFDRQQIRWAAAHDWFAGVTDCGQILMRDDYGVLGVDTKWVYGQGVLILTSFRRIRDMAGY